VSSVAGDLACAAPQWLGLIVMIGYAILLGGLGIALTRRRDIG
jgi:putative exporter of polyketide antibiotics